MKMSSLAFSTSLAILFAFLTLNSCTKNEQETQPFICPQEALFQRVGATGTMLYLPCYESWSIKLEETNPEGIHLIAASLDIPTAFQIDSLEVKIEACFYEFDLELLYPDPVPWGEMYIIKDYNISSDL